MGNTIKSNTIKIENWHFTLEPGNPYASPETRTPLICGKIFGSDRIAEGDFGSIDLSRITRRVGETLYSISNNKYELGSPKSDYETQFPDARARILSQIIDTVELPEVTTVFSGPVNVRIVFFSSLAAYPSMYALLILKEGKYELVNEGVQGLKVFLSRASRDRIYDEYNESNPELFFTGGSIEIKSNLKITGYAPTMKAAHGELV